MNARLSLSLPSACLPPMLQGYAAVGADPVAATAQRIDGLRQAGVLRDDPPSPAGSACSARGAAGASPSAAMPSSKSCEDLRVARSGGSQVGRRWRVPCWRLGSRRPAARAGSGGMLAPPPPACSHQPGVMASSH